MKLLMTCGNDKFLLDTARKVQEKCPLSYLIGQHLSQKEFPDVYILDERDLMNPQYYAEANRDSRFVLSETIINEFADCERAFLANTDRLSFIPSSYRKRKIIYYDILLFWYRFFKENDVDAIFLGTTPHMGWDIVLYAVAQFLQKKVFYLERTCINDTMFFVDDYRNEQKVPIDYLNDKNKEDMIELLGEEFYQSIFKESYWVNAPSSVPVKKGKKIKFSQKLRSVLGTIKYLLTPKNYFERTTPSVFAYNGSLRKSTLGLVEILRKRRDRKNKKYYQSLVQDIDVSKKFIFFPLQFQPERTSIPLGGIFEDQILALQILSRSIPADWKIYVKEHPRQLDFPRINALHFRNKDYYDRIKRINKVQFINVEENTHQLMEKSVVTATLTGSIGWESILSGKSCLVFGFPWYQGCRSCYRVNSVESCKEILHLIKEESKKEVEMNLLKYLHFLKPQLFIASNSEHFAAKSQRKYTELSENLAKAIASYIREDKDVVRSRNKLLLKSEEVL